MLLLCAGLSRWTSPRLLRLPDPQETQLGAEVGSISDVGEVFGVTGGAGRHRGPLRHRVVVYVLGRDPAFFEEDSAAGNSRD